MAAVKYHHGGFPPRALDLQRLLPLVGPANAELARYDGILSAVPNAAVLLTPLTTQEAVLSSRIEGTQATLGEVLEYEAGMEPAEARPEKVNDIQEVLNYRKAMRKALDLLEELPLCERLVREVHAVLLAGVRGRSRSPGKYRKIQNWIGPRDRPIDEAKFIPIEANRLPQAMRRWEKFLHTEYPDRLVQLGLIHVEFEALHPFLDGNGRLGRMLIPLFMYKTALLSMPCFYISAYFERDREQYYERLKAVSRDSDWTGWCEYFLQSVIEQAKENNHKARAVLDLHERMQHEVPKLTHSQYAVPAVEFLFQRPVFKTSDFVRVPEIPDPTGRRILKVLRDNGVLKTLRPGSGRRPAVLAFPELLNVAEGRDVL